MVADHDEQGQLRQHLCKLSDGFYRVGDASTTRQQLHKGLPHGFSLQFSFNRADTAKRKSTGKRKALSKTKRKRSTEAEDLLHQSLDGPPPKKARTVAANGTAASRSLTRGVSATDELSRTVLAPTHDGEHEIPQTPVDPSGPSLSGQNSTAYSLALYTTPGQAAGPPTSSTDGNSPPHQDALHNTVRQAPSSPIHPKCSGPTPSSFESTPSRVPGSSGTSPTEGAVVIMSDHTTVPPNEASKDLHMTIEELLRGSQGDDSTDPRDQPIGVIPENLDFTPRMPPLPEATGLGSRPETRELRLRNSSPPPAHYVPSNVEPVGDRQLLEALGLMYQSAGASGETDAFGQPTFTYSSQMQCNFDVFLEEYPVHPQAQREIPRDIRWDAPMFPAEPVFIQDMATLNVGSNAAGSASTRLATGWD
ncbi:hypothetical protein CALCODRAFT_280393 [Calocera cornea HHB12733]|uniref:Uncharacterized protein n=1 Tax=Calocera cornea HHB12733 TaxID=1353952 RepID=A0A165JSP2_9BASI|nr:hypothetical protein CALCODRAFT_280393 [Calocera cornea HHB12733]